MAGETCVDFDFSDILSKIEDLPITKKKSSQHNGFLKPVSYSFDLDNLSNFNHALHLKDDSSDEDLSLLLDSHQSQNSELPGLISLASLAKDHFSSTTSSSLTSSSGEDSVDSYLFNLEKNCSDDDLSVLLDSHQSQNHEPPGLISLASLAKDHLSSTTSSSLTSNSGEDSVDSFFFNLKKDCCDESEPANCLQDILLGGSSKEPSKNANLGGVLDFLDLKSTADVNADNCLQKKQIVAEEELSDNELLQDIDLSFCLKKSKDKAEFLPSSFNSDSGFGEFDSSLSQYSSNSSNVIVPCENLKRNDQVKFTLTRARQSLFSRSIAAKPQMDKSRRRKLNMIRSELLKRNISLPSEQEREQIMKKFLSMVNQSNQCVMTSSFLTIPDQK